MTKLSTLGNISRHPLEALNISLMNLWDLKVIFLELIHELISVQHAVASPRLEDFRLFFKSKIPPGEIGLDICFIKLQDLIVRNSSWVSEDRKSVV